MGSLFQRRANHLLRIALAGVALAIVAVFGVAMVAYSSNYYTQVRFIPDQPVPFSHKHHAGELGIDCRYCHTSVEKSSFAGIPSPSTCMHCHSQIWPEARMLEPVRDSFNEGRPLAWSRVNSLPDYVYFNHSIHIAKGVRCAACHGRIDEMPGVWKHASLEMVWCLSCHRHPQRYGLGKELTIQSKTDCDACHR
jgi:hypothetical protein